MRARAPASAANLGPGLDVLAVALDLYVEVTVEPADRLSVSSEGEGADLPADGSHLAARVAASVCGHDRLAIRVRSEVPVARGLGSSAAIALAAAAAAGAEDPLAVAACVDGHADNAAAAFAGGLVAVSAADDGPGHGPDRDDGQDHRHQGSQDHGHQGSQEHGHGQDGGRDWRVSRLALDAGLAFVAVVPDRLLETARARAVLPVEVPRADAVFNLGRLALLLEGLGDRRRLVARATEDRLHQGQRTPLFPEAPKLLAALQAGGARAACWSGAGPTLLGICEGSDAARVAGAGRAALADAGLAGRVLELHADVGGLVVGEHARLPARRGGARGAPA